MERSGQVRLQLHLHILPGGDLELEVDFLTWQMALRVEQFSCLGPCTDVEGRDSLCSLCDCTRPCIFMSSPLRSKNHLVLERLLGHCSILGSQKSGTN